MAAEIAVQRLEPLREEARLAHQALHAAEEHARALHRTHDERVSRADEERTRALRLAMALSPPEGIPLGLRVSLGRHAREQQLKRALTGRTSERPESRVPSVAEAMQGLETARIERARALAALLPELDRLRANARRTTDALREAEEDLQRLRS